MPVVRLRRTIAAKTLGFSERGALRSTAAPSEGRQIQKLQTDASRNFQEFYDANGVRRVRIGRQTDGTFGTRIWDSSSVLRSDLTWA